MRNEQKNSIVPNLALILGSLGVVAGIVLIFLESWVMGISGFIASAGLAYKGYQNAKAKGE